MFHSQQAVLDGVVNGLDLEDSDWFNEDFFLFKNIDKGMALAALKTSSSGKKIFSLFIRFFCVFLQSFWRLTCCKLKQIKWTSKI